jgi:hypothetical protein
MHSWALKSAVCTIFPVHGYYWPTQGINPILSLPSSSPDQTECYIYTATQQPTQYNSEDGGSMYLQCAGNIAQNHTLCQNPRTKLILTTTKPHSTVKPLSIVPG